MNIIINNDTKFKHLSVYLLPESLWKYNIVSMNVNTQHGIKFRVRILKIE